MKLFKYLLPALLLACSSNDQSINLEQDSTIVQDSMPEIHDTLQDNAFVIPEIGIEAGSFDNSLPSLGKMNYHGGSVMTAPVNVYLLWYGDWKNQDTQNLVEYVISNVGKSDWFQINTKYYQQIESKNNLLPDANIPYIPKLYTTNNINFIQSNHITYTHGKSLTDEDIGSVVSEEIESGRMPLDINGIYFVLTASDVDQGNGWFNFCQVYCGWHQNIIKFNSDIKIAFVGDISSCYNCSMKPTYKLFGFDNSPNNNWEADEMMSVMLHELSESVTDPDYSAGWLDSNNQENADKCAWTFGDLKATSDRKSVYNISIGEKQFLVQQNWVLLNDGSGYCGLSL